MPEAAAKFDPQASSRRDARRHAMLDAALELFLEKGYGAVSLNEVVRRSGGSLSTLYDLFGGKLGLLKACVAERCSALLEIGRAHV